MPNGDLLLAESVLQVGVGASKWCWILGLEGIDNGHCNIVEGRKEWQLSGVVFIPKANKDHKAAKGWRHINLINCIGKLAEKVVADELQKGLVHKGQYESIKGRSALEAMTRALARAAQRTLATGGKVLWVMEDVKEGFNNVLGQEVFRPRTRP